MTADQLRELRRLLYRKHRLKAVTLYVALGASLPLCVAIIFVAGMFLADLSFVLIMFVVPPLAIFLLLMISKLRERLAAQLLSARGYNTAFAEEVLAAKQPYAMYLRGFDFEQNDIEFDGFDQEMDTPKVRVYTKPVDRLISALLNPEIALLSLNDPRHPVPLPGAHRFYETPAKWEEFVVAHIADASVIFLYLSSFSKSISIELRLLSNPKWAEKVLIIVSRSMVVQDSRRGKQIALRLPAFKHIVFEQIHAVKWTKKEEKQFHTRLKASMLQIGESENGAQHILQPGNAKLPGTALSPLAKRLRFIVGPVIWSALPFAAILLIQVVSSPLLSHSREELWRFIKESLIYYPLVLLAFLWFKFRLFSR